MLNILSIHVLLRGRKPWIKSTQSKKPEHINSHISHGWMEAERVRGRKELEQARIRALNIKQGFLKSTLQGFYVSLPDVSTLGSRPVPAGGSYFQAGYCTSGSLQMMLVGGRHIQRGYSSLEKC